MWECDCCEHLNPLDNNRCENCHSKRDQTEVETEKELEIQGYPSSTIHDEQDEEK
jgi:hypothetical protein